LLLGGAASARAQVVVRVGGEPVDTLAFWISDAKAHFQSNQGDSATGDNARPYEDVGLVARRLLRTHEFGGPLAARAIKPALDSLGFLTEVAEDPAWPGFALLMVRNPYRPDAAPVGFIYWYREKDLRLQGAVFQGGLHPRLKLWRSTKHDYPYECGVIDETRDGVLRLMVLGMSLDGTYWDILDDEVISPSPGRPVEAAWVDVNRDDLPEIVTWSELPTDSLFTECMDCPTLMTERLLVEAGRSFEIEDEHLLATPYATLVYFVRLLLDGKLTQAQRLVRDPAKVSQAVAEGWNKRVVKNPWRVEYRESGQPWPRRLEVRFEGPHGVKRYDFVFAKSGDHWVIENWFEPKAVTGSYPSVTVPGPAPKRPAPGASPKGAPPRPKKR
jgi:hypothetical protein